MIDIKRKEDCVGCEACMQRCPVQCISRVVDPQGFVYPKVDVERCIDCGVCEKVCPVINQCEMRRPERTFAASSKDENVRMLSSSGGIFYALAKKTIEEGGVVFGARFSDRWEVIHDFTETVEGIVPFLGSKYVQSRIGNSYQDAERFLKAGRKVMFTGTPCQLAGLRLFLRKDHGDRLLLVDVVCHGVPSPLVWEKYRASLKQGSAGIEKISFRDKKMGWESYGLSITSCDSKPFYEPMYDNLYMQTFLDDLCLRPSCYECPAKCGKSHSDITLGDFWGIRRTYPELYDCNGVSLVLANSGSGCKTLENLDIDMHEVSYVKASAGNVALDSSARRPEVYEAFWRDFLAEGVVAMERYVKMLGPGRCQRYIRKVKGFVKRIIGLRV